MYCMYRNLRSSAPLFVGRRSIDDIILLTYLKSSNISPNLLNFANFFKILSLDTSLKRIGFNIMDVDQSLDALIKAAPKATKKPTKAASKAKKKVTLKKKVQPKKKVSSVKVSVKSGRGTKMIRKNTGGRGKPIGGRAVGMAIDQVVRNTGGARSIINNIASPNAKTNEAPTKLIVSNLDFNVTEKDIKVCCVVVIIG